MDGQELKKIQTKLSELRVSEGIEYENGRKYLGVAKRLEIFRGELGDEYGITTSWGIYGDEKNGIIIRAEVTNKNGFTVASGLSFCEHPNHGGIETAETKAIGRALACLGLSGGEYASADEMAKVLSPKGLDKPPEPCKAQPQSLTEPASESDAEVVVDLLIAMLNNKDHVKSAEDIMEFHQKNESLLSLLMDKFRPSYKRWSAAVSQRRKELKRG